MKPRTASFLSMAGVGRCPSSTRASGVSSSSTCPPCGRRFYPTERMADDLTRPQPAREYSFGVALRGSRQALALVCEESHSVPRSVEGWDGSRWWVGTTADPSRSVLGLWDVEESTVLGGGGESVPAPCWSRLP